MLLAGQLVDATTSLHLTDRPATRRDMGWAAVGRASWRRDLSPHEGAKVDRLEEGVLAARGGAGLNGAKALRGLGDE